MRAVWLSLLGLAVLACAPDAGGPDPVNVGDQGPAAPERPEIPDQGPPPVEPGPTQCAPQRLEVEAREVRVSGVALSDVAGAVTVQLSHRDSGRVHTVIADPDGHFEVAVVVGSYTAWVSDDRAGAVDIEAWHDLEVDLRAEHIEISGTVMARGAPAVGAQVTAVGPSGEVRGRTDDVGGFWLRVPAGGPIAVSWVGGGARLGAPLVGTRLLAEVGGQGDAEVHAELPVVQADVQLARVGAEAVRRDLGSGRLAFFDEAGAPLGTAPLSNGADIAAVEAEPGPVWVRLEGRSEPPVRVELVAGQLAQAVFPRLFTVQGRLGLRGSQIRPGLCYGEAQLVALDSAVSVTTRFARNPYRFRVPAGRYRLTVTAQGGCGTGSLETELQVSADTMRDDVVTGRPVLVAAHLPPALAEAGGVVARLVPARAGAQFVGLIERSAAIFEATAGDYQGWLVRPGRRGPTLAPVPLGPITVGAEGASLLVEPRLVPVDVALSRPGHRRTHPPEVQLVPKDGGAPIAIEVGWSTGLVTASVWVPPGRYALRVDGAWAHDADGRDAWTVACVSDGAE